MPESVRENVQAQGDGLELANTERLEEPTSQAGPTDAPS